MPSPTSQDATADQITSANGTTAAGELTEIVVSLGNTLSTPSAIQTGSGATTTTLTQEKRIFAGVPRAPRLCFPVWVLPPLVATFMAITTAHAVGWGRWTGFDRTAAPPLFVSGPPPDIFPKSSPWWKGERYDHVQTPLWHVLLTLLGCLFLVHSIVISISARAVIGRGAMLPMKTDKSVEPRWRMYARNIGNFAGVATSVFFIAAGSVSNKFRSHTVLLLMALILLWFWAFAYTLSVAWINLEMKSDLLNAVVMATMCCVMLFSGFFVMILYGFNVYGCTSVTGFVYMGSTCVFLGGVAWNNRREKMILVTQFGHFQ